MNTETNLTAYQQHVAKYGAKRVLIWIVSGSSLVSLYGTPVINEEGTRAIWGDRRTFDINNMYDCMWLVVKLGMTVGVDGTGARARVWNSDPWTFVPGEPDLDDAQAMKNLRDAILGAVVNSAYSAYSVYPQR